MRKLLWVWMVWGVVINLRAQMPVGQDTLYGMEWIQPEQAYLNFKVGVDGFYRITYEELVAQGWPVDEVTAQQYTLHNNGQPVFLHSSRDWSQPLTAGDYLLFYGQQNRGELDAYLYRDPDNQQLNPSYSLHSDTATYYLSWSTSVNSHRFETITNELSNLPAAEPYVWRTAETVLSNHFTKEYYRISGATLYYSHMGIGEGYGSRSINQLLQDGTTRQTVDLTLSNLHEPGPSTRLETRYVAALFAHDQQLAANGVVIRRDTFQNWRMLNVTTELPPASRNGAQLTLEWEGFGGAKDEVSVGFVRANYPAVPRWTDDEELFSCQLTNAGTRQYLAINDFSGNAAVLFDLANGYRLTTLAEEGQLNFGLPNTNRDRDLRILAEESAAPALAATPVELVLPNTDGANYIILTHSALRGEGDPVQAYAAYRASQAGGGYRTAIVNVDVVYDLFGYGIQHYPLAIRNFLAWQRRTNPAFEFLFLIGKGREYKDIRSPDQLAEVLETSLFVPTFGFPGSDNLLVSSKTKPTPLVATGRLAATSPEEVRLYLQKIQTMEANVANAPHTIAGKGWMKQVLHLGGGATASERQSIRNQLERFATNLAQGRFGGATTSFYKASSDPIEVSQTESIFGRINAGVSMITFFGHSSAGNFDFSIDQPENYENAGKYPLMLSLGCYSGNSFTASKSVGERFIFLDNGAAGAYAASRGLGFIHALGAFGNTFSSLASNDRYGEPVGKLFQASIQPYENFTDIAYGALMEQFSLQGDPALRLNPAAGEDYLIDNGSVVFEPRVINIQQDSFAVNFKLYNLGKRESDSLDILVQQELPDGSVRTHFTSRVPAVGYVADIRLTIPALGKAAIGQNRLRLTVDPANLIFERPNPVAEQNNEVVQQGKLGAPFFVIDNSAFPVWPPEFALVGTADLVLKASTADALAPTRKYYLELSQSPDFTTLAASTSLVQKGGVLRWQPQVSWEDSTVYYWRVAPDTIGQEVAGFLWESSSFRHVEAIDWGWGQADWGQYQVNDFSNTQIDRTSKQLVFTDNTLDVAIRNKVYDPDDEPSYFNRDRFIGSPWTWSIHEGLNVVVLPFPTLDYWRNPLGGEYGSINTASNWASVLPFAYPTDNLEDRTNLINFLTEVVPDSAYVLVYSAQRTPTSSYYPEQWATDSLTLAGRNIFNVLENEGANLLRATEERGALPYVLFYQKGVGLIGEALAESIDGDAVVAHGFQGRWYEGEMSTVTVGPVAAWERLELRFEPATIDAGDSIRLVLEGSVDLSDWQTIWQEEGAPQTFYTTDLSTLSTMTYPYLRLRYSAYDIDRRSIPQIDYVHLYHAPLAELAINPNHLYRFADTVLRGEQLELVYSIENLGVTDVSELVVAHEIGNSTIVLENRLLGTLPAGATVVDTIQISSEEADAELILTSVANPADEPQEYQRFNNTIVSRALIRRDVIDPTLTVTFDGRIILNGDLVAPEPVITISLQDENPFLPLNNPDLVKLYLRTPSSGDFDLIPQEDYVWQSAFLSEGENEARIDYTPSLSEDGLYALRIEARDASRNPAGREDRIIEFEVVNAQTISNVLPYPNPFSTETRFVYTLTGAPPSDFALQIMTVSGRTVKEVSAVEFGDLQVGTHLSDYTWDGTDNYGDRLANGVYLYRFIAQDEQGQALEVRDNGSSAYFKNGIGKVVILR